MLQSLYTALTGLRSQQYNIDTTANNVANVNTVGFKASRVDFADALYALIERPIESGTYLQNGTGGIVGGVQKLTDAGVPVPTARSLDFMLDGEGYFTLQGPQGQLYFTRDGSFKVSVEAGGNYLVSAEGYHVLGADNNPIQIPGDASQVAAGPTGVLSMSTMPFAALKITKFTNPEGLADAGGNKLTATAASGTATAGAGTTVVRQGFLEGSNVDLATELTRLIRAQRAYSVLGTAIRTTDDMESQSNNLVK